MRDYFRIIMLFDINMSSRQDQLMRALNLASTGQRISQEEDFKIREELRDEEMEDIRLEERDAERARLEEIQRGIEEKLGEVDDDEEEARLQQRLEEVQRLQVEEELRFERDDEKVYDFLATPLISPEDRNGMDIDDLDDLALVKLLIEEMELTGRVRVRLVDKFTGEVYEEQEYNVEGRNWFNDANGADDWAEDYESRRTVFREHATDLSGSNLRLIFDETEPLGGQLAPQSFRDGKYHCLLNPMKVAFLKKYDESSARGTRSTYANMIKKVDKYLLMYEGGVPECKMQDMVNDLKVDIHIQDVMSMVKKGSMYAMYKSHIRRRMIFKFINTRLNHVEYTDCFINTYHQAEEITERSEMDRIVRKLDDTDQHYLYSSSKDAGYKSIHTKDKFYIYKTEYSDIVNDFEKEEGIDKCSLYYDERSTKFARQAVHVGGAVDFTDTIHKIKGEMGKELNKGYVNAAKGEKLCIDITRIDHKASYASFKGCNYYEGFPALYSRWRYVDTDEDPVKFMKDRPGGEFYVEDITYDAKEGGEYIMDRNTKKILMTLNCYVRDTKRKSYMKRHEKKSIFIQRSGVYPGPELRYLWDIGARFTLVAALWGPKTLSFDIPDTMFKEENGLRHYKRWAGMCMSVKGATRYRMRCDIPMANHLKGMGYDVYMYKDDAVCNLVVNRPDSMVRTKCHIASYILSYSRIQILQQLFLIPYDKIIRVTLDDIYFVKHDRKFELRDGYRMKEIKWFSFTGDENDYLNYYDDLELPEADDTVYPNSRGVGEHIHVVTGGPGTGKTHSTIKNPLWCNVLYTAPSHKLRSYVKKKYNIQTAVHSNLLSGRVHISLTTAYSDRRIPSVIIVDEATQMGQGTLNTVVEQFPYSEIILVGDFDGKKGFCYQLNPAEGNPLDIGNYCNTELTHNYRAEECGRLADMVTIMRTHMYKLYGDKVPNGGYKGRGDGRLFRNHVLRVSKYYDVTEGEVRDLLGCTESELEEYIGRQWYDSKMNWGNYGSYWNLDHVVPVSVGERKEIVCSYHNLQPLTVEENSLKGNSTGRRKGGFSLKSEEDFVDRVLFLLKDRIITPEDATREKGGIKLKDMVLVGRRRCIKCKIGVGGVKRCKGCKKKANGGYCKLCKLCRCEAKTRVGKFSGVSYWASTLANRYMGEQYNGVVGNWRKYLVVKNVRGVDGEELHNGDIVISDKEVRGSEERYAFTVHQTQGETIEEDIYIDMDNLFDPCRMLYTAISRAKRIDQIHLVKNPIV